MKFFKLLRGWDEYYSTQDNSVGTCGAGNSQPGSHTCSEYLMADLYITTVPHFALWASCVSVFKRVQLKLSIVQRQAVKLLLGDRAGQGSICPLPSHHHVLRLFYNAEVGGVIYITSHIKNKNQSAFLKSGTLKDYKRASVIICFFYSAHPAYRVSQKKRPFTFDRP